MRPPPQDLPNAQPGEVAEQRLGLQDDVALLDELLASPEASDRALQLVVGHAEAVPVAMFEVDTVPEIIRNPTEVVGCSGSRRSFSLSDRAMTPRLSWFTRFL